MSVNNNRFFSSFTPHAIIFAGIILVLIIIIGQLYTYNKRQTVSEGAPLDTNFTPEQRNHDLPNQTEIEEVVNTLQAMPTVAPSLVIIFDGTQPATNRNYIPLNGVFRLENQTDLPIDVSFSSGTSMTVGALGGMELTMLKSGLEVVSLTYQNSLYSMTLDVGSE